MTKELSTDFHYTDLTVGLPDFLYLSPESGMLDERLLAKAIGILNHHHKKASLSRIASLEKKRGRSNSFKLTAGKYPLIDAYANPRNRRDLFFSSFHSLLKNFRDCGQYNPAAIVAPSLEMKAFVEFAPELLSDPSTYEVELAEAHGIDKEMLEGLMANNKSYKVALQATVSVKNKAFNELLQHWDDATEERRQQLALIIHCVATILHAQAMNEAFSIRPTLKGYFTQMLALAHNQDMSCKYVDQAKGSVVIECGSHEQWLTQIQVALDAVKQDSNIPAAREALLATVTAYGDWASRQPDKEDGLFALKDMTSTLAAVARGHGIEDPCVIEAERAYAAFVGCWTKWAFAPQYQSMRLERLIEQTTQRWRRLIEHSATINEQRGALAVARQHLHTTEQKVDTDGRSSRRLATERAAAAAQVAQIELALTQAEEDYIHDLLPEGAELKDLDMDTHNAPTPEGVFGGIIVDAMNQLRDWLEGNVLSRRDPCETVIDDTGQASANKASPEKLSSEEQLDDEYNDANVPDDTMEEVAGGASDNPIGSRQVVAETETARVICASGSEIEPPSVANVDAHTKGPSDQGTGANQESPGNVTPEVQEPTIEPQSKPAIEVGSKVTPIINLQKYAMEQAQSEEGREALAALAANVYIDGRDVNAALTRLVADNQLPAAAQLAYAIEKRKLSDGFLSYTLLKAAYYGVNTFDGRTVFNKARRQLLAIDNGQFDEWTGLANADMVPYLMLLATFQPALFGGNASTAFTRLREIPDTFFDSATRSLIEGMTQVANRGEQATISLLRAGGQAKNEATVFDAMPLKQWIQKIREARRGYAPVLKSQAYCLDHGEFKQITEILLSNDRQQHDVVENFVATYQDQDATNELLNETLDIINIATGAGITRIGKQRFYHKVMELVNIAKDWLEAGGHTKGSALESFCKGFTTRLVQSISHFEAVACDTGSSPGHHAGATIVAEYFKQLLAMVTTHRQPWPYRRVKGWYYHPRDIAAMDLPFASDSSPEVIQWLLTRIGGELCSLDSLKHAMSLGKVRLAELLRLKLEEDGMAVEDVDTRNRFLEVQRNLVRQCIALEAKLEDAMLAGLIDSSRAELFSDQLSDSLETIEQLELLDDIDEIQSHLEGIDRELKERTANEKREQQTRYEKGVQQLRLAVADNPVPDDWIYELENAFADDNIPVIKEMLDELDDAVTDTRRIEPVQIKNVPMLGEFLAHQEAIYKGVMNDANAGKRSLWHGVVEGGEQFGLDFEYASSMSKTALKKAVEALAGWSATKPPHEMNQDLHNRLVAVMDALGIRAKDTQYSSLLSTSMNYQTAIGFSSVRLTVLPSPSTRPFALFGSRKEGGGQLPVMIAYKPWEPESLGELMTSHGIHDEALLISAVPLSAQQRDAFAHWCKRNQRTILHIDMVMLLFLGTQISDSVENIYVRNFLWLASPFTYFNPYGGENMSPPFPEMRYGREKQITKLLRMEGAAIVYGGRQLGKSTILQEVQRRFHQPKQRQYAFYEMLDKDLDKRIHISQEAHDKARRRIWDFMYRNLQKYDLIGKTQNAHDIDAVIHAVKEALMQHRDASFIVIFDEIDPVLNVDSHHDFSIFRGLRDLVAHRDVKGRFKVIIGGLENVKRFENSPNYPLTQMGSTTPVEILPTQEALHLVKEPLLAAGYRFENGRVANRILATTNRHPGLIQVFCHELIDYLCNNRKTRIGDGVITSEDVESVARLQKVLDLIRNRFDMTLNLDHRYLVIVYGIIADGRGTQPFSTEYAKGVAEVWLPEAFGQLSHRQFEAFLDELVGLGVLRKNNDGRFALRNTNVLKLLANVQGDDVGHQLERAIKNYNNYDPMDRHAFDPTRHTVPSPITYRDERVIIGVSFGGTPDAAEPTVPGIRHKIYTTTLVAGSQAQGLLDLVNTLPSIYEEESTDHTVREGRQPEYVAHTYHSTGFKSAMEFEKKLLSPLTTKKAMEAPQMVFIEVSDQTPLVDFLSMIDAAHQYTPTQGAASYPVRLLFLMGPGVYWNWLQHQKITAPREGLQPFIKLGNWSTGAVRALLEKLNMNDSTSAVEEALTVSQGWYHSLKIIAKTRMSHSSWTDLSQFSSLTPMTELDRKLSGQFLELCGINKVPWAKDLLRVLIEQAGEALDRDDIELFADEAGLSLAGIGGIHTALRWLLDMGLLVSRRKADDKSAHYEIAPAVRHALSMYELHESA
ncbi:MAG: hypothetical protein RBT75_04060 [Anaerolineae bacterium]|jgi:hypothetical protein|nr:hypothetical protein [Anaerolineae bacterium]